jgi:GT2 family glycosyltransferase
VSAPPSEPLVDVLIPTLDRPSELAITLAGLAAQDDPAFRVVVSDQSRGASPWESAGVASMLRVLRAQGREVEQLRHLPRRGIAEHRQFLLDQARAELVLFLDDDVWLEPGTLTRMVTALSRLDCGFVGSAVQGLSYLDDVRPEEHAAFEPWSDRVEPETVRRDTAAFDRWPLHNAANLVHLAAERGLTGDDWLAYKIAWVGGCVLYRRDALIECGGFGFWSQLDRLHSGADVTVQWAIMQRYGGAGLLPSGAVHLEAATTMPVRNVDAYDVVFGAGRS